MTLFLVVLISFIVLQASELFVPPIWWTAYCETLFFFATTSHSTFYSSFYIVLLFVRLRVIITLAILPSLLLVFILLLCPTNTAYLLVFYWSVVDMCESLSFRLSLEELSKSVLWLSRLSKAHVISQLRFFSERCYDESIGSFMFTQRPFISLEPPYLFYIVFDFVLILR